MTSVRKFFANLKAEDEKKAEANKPYTVKYYEENKSKILDYKKNFYFEKNKIYIALKNFQLEKFSKRESDKIIKSAIKNGNITIQFNNINYTLEDFLDNYGICGNLLIHGYLYTVEGERHFLTYLPDEIIKILDKEYEDTNDKPCVKFIIQQLPIFKKNSKPN